MHESLANHTAALRQHQDRLLRRYDADALHDLRVCIRRIRSLLKHSDDHLADSYRKNWAGFSAETNAAREWDVFFKAAGRTLDREEMDEFRKRIRAPREASHRVVKDMLRSPRWEGHMTDWNGHCAGLSLENVNTLSPLALKSSIDKAERRAKKALARNTVSGWHRLRIAIKDVRYIAMACPDSPAGDERRSELIDTAEALQTSLGRWHDCANQLQCLEDMPQGIFTAKLNTRLKRRQRYYLSRTRKLLEDRFHPWIVDGVNG